jgi:FG-GAP repeat protein
VKFSMNQAAARMYSGSKEGHSKPGRHLGWQVTASALLSAFIAVPASAQPINEDIKIVASDAAAFDEFSVSVAISGTTAIVGAPFDDDGGADSGSAYLFDTTNWLQVAKLTASDTALFDNFGFSVAISGTTAIVGAWANNDGGADSGSAYLFETTTGLQVAKLTASDAAANDFFGRSVAISGTTAIVGAWGNNDAGTGSGSAYLFDTTDGHQIAKLTASDAASLDIFGHSVAISGTTAIVGAWGNNDAGTDSGSAYLFDTSTGLQIAKLTASDAAAGDQFGSSVAISSTTAIVGAKGDNSISGSAYLFDTTTGFQIAKLTASDAAAGDEFGVSVAISGTTAIVGAWGNDDAGNNSGSAYLFDTTDGHQIAKLAASDAAAYDTFGGSVAISSTTAIIGAQAGDDAGTNSGSAYLFEVSGTSCQADLNNDGVLDFFDVQVFLNWYAAGDLRADLVDDGMLDFFDVQAFLNMYAAGCP